MIKPTKWRLRTATENPARTDFRHAILVADIEDVITLIDIMNSEDSYWLQAPNPDGDEELFLHGKSVQTIHVMLAKDVLTPERSEIILAAHQDGNVENETQWYLSPEYMTTR